MNDSDEETVIYTECRECGRELEDGPTDEAGTDYCHKHQDDTIEEYDLRGDR